jgi:hypothetical protein
MLAQIQSDGAMLPSDAAESRLLNHNNVAQ